MNIIPRHLWGARPPKRAFRITTPPEPPAELEPADTDDEYGSFVPMDTVTANNETPPATPSASWATTNTNGQATAWLT